MLSPYTESVASVMQRILRRIGRAELRCSTEPVKEALRPRAPPRAVSEQPRTGFRISVLEAEAGKRLADRLLAVPGPARQIGSTHLRPRRANPEGLRIGTAERRE